jgi:hypothetical protein
MAGRRSCLQAAPSARRHDRGGDRAHGTLAHAARAELSRAEVSVQALTFRLQYLGYIEGNGDQNREQP